MSLRATLPSEDHPPDGGFREVARTIFPGVEEGTGERLLRQSGEGPAEERAAAADQLVRLANAAAGRRGSSPGRPECARCGSDSCSGDCGVVRLSDVRRERVRWLWSGR